MATDLSNVNELFNLIKKRVSELDNSELDNSVVEEPLPEISECDFGLTEFTVNNDSLTVEDDFGKDFGKDFNNSKKLSNQSLIDVIKTKSSLNDSFFDDRTDLDELFVNSIHKTIKEIVRGADNDEFADLVIINFIISGDKAGYSTNEIKGFIKELSPENFST